MSNFLCTFSFALIAQTFSGNRLDCFLHTVLSDEHEGTQKKTFTKWINAQLAKVLIKKLLFNWCACSYFNLLFHLPVRC